MSNTELISNFISLHCDRCDLRTIVKEGGTLIYSCSAEVAGEYLSTGSCFSAEVYGKKGVMSPNGFIRSEVQQWDDKK